MGRRWRAKQRQRAQAAARDPKKMQAEIDRLYKKKFTGLKSVLLETPSGFAIFSIDASLMDKENALEHIWANFVKDFMVEKFVNDDIVETACFFYDCDLVVEKHSRSLHMSDDDLMKISGLNSKDWGTMKIATAMKMIAYPEEEIEHPSEMFTEDELLKIKKDASKYYGRIRKHNIALVFKELVGAIECKKGKVKLMKDLVQKATEKV